MGGGGVMGLSPFVQTDVGASLSEGAWLFYRQARVNKAPATAGILLASAANTVQIQTKNMWLKIPLQAETTVTPSQTNLPSRLLFIEPSLRRRCRAGRKEGWREGGKEVPEGPQPLPSSTPPAVTMTAYILDPV